ncbi:phasin family protein [Candidatus Magnetominusculus dajiuhuensis]|uniref:phasin family protein n=1 Tax=Candidatus Magnetominusculus dajiuhuensis TaxID=3137712 RepID=UPI003B427DE3
MLFDMIRNTIMAALGAQETLKEFIDGLVEKGQLSESQGKSMIDEWSEKITNAGSGINANISEIIDLALSKMNLATKDDIEKLNKKIAALAQRLAAHEGDHTENA